MGVSRNYHIQCREKVFNRDIQAFQRQRETRSIIKSGKIFTLSHFSVNFSAQISRRSFAHNVTVVAGIVGQTQESD